MKVMAFGAIAAPMPEYNFDGKVLLECVSKLKTVKQSSQNQKFTDDLHINNELKKGVWQRFL